MLTYTPLKNNAGLLILGDYLSLKNLHAVLHSVNEVSTLVHDKEGCLMDLAYEVRHAMQGDSVIQKAPEDEPQIGLRYGFRVVWTDLLLCTRLIRDSLAFFDSSKSQQSVTYELESLIEEAVAECFKEKSASIVDAFSILSCRHPASEENLRGRTSVFCGLNKADRKFYLRGILVSLDPSYDHSYELFYKNTKDLLPPEVFKEAEKYECPDPKW